MIAKTDEYRKAISCLAYDVVATNMPFSDANKFAEFVSRVFHKPDFVGDDGAGTESTVWGDLWVALHETATKMRIDDPELVVDVLNGRG